MDLNFSYTDFPKEEQPIENSPINHDECSDDRPLKKDFMSIIEDVNIENPWEQPVVQVEERQEEPKEESNENKKPLDEAVLPPEFKGVKEEQNRKIQEPVMMTDSTNWNLFLTAFLKKWKNSKSLLISNRKLSKVKNVR